ncbi:MAG TPA: hypothetical protein VMG30_12945 [Acidobacteriota bacterium]|nr:hypothetical protein [Acidobacteriota bacterium]
MATKDAAALLSKDFIIVKIDIDRGIGAKDLAKRFNDKEQGLPWFVFLDGNGKRLIDSLQPKTGSIGHPAQPEEVAYFKTMIQYVKKHLTDHDIDALIQSLEAFNKAAGIQPANAH